MITLDHHLRRLLMRSKKVDLNQLDKLDTEARKMRVSLLDLVIDSNLVKEEFVIRKICERFSVSPIHLDLVTASTELLELFSREEAEKYSIFPISKIGDTVTVATSNPLDMHQAEDLKIIKGYTVVQVFALPKAIQKAISQHYPEPQKEFVTPEETFEYASKAPPTFNNWQMTRELSCFICRHLIPGGRIIADAIEGYASIKNAQLRSKADEVLSVMAKEGKYVLQHIQRLEIRTQKQMSILTELPTVQDQMKNLTNKVERRLENLGDLIIQNMETLQSGQQNILHKIQQLHNDIYRFKNIRSLGNRSSLHDSLVVQPSDKRTVKKLLTEYRMVKESKDIKVQMFTEMGMLCSATGEEKEAEKIYTQGLVVAKSHSQKALIEYNRYINYVQTRNFPEAFACYKRAIDLDKNYQLFESRKYKPLEIIGAGAYGVAFLCESLLGEKVVVKSLVTPNKSQNDNKLREVIREAQALKKISSPYIISLEDYGYADWRNYRDPYVVMGHAKGQDLETYIDNHGAIPFEQSIKIAVAIAKGLKKAHEAGVIHRDLKPSNIIYEFSDDEFQLKIVDFGLAGGLKDNHALIVSNTIASERSIIGESIVGTLRYAPPEQLKEKVAGKEWPIREYSDIYSYGKTLRKIFLGELEAKARKVDRFTHKEILYLLDDCLEKNPLERPQSFTEVLDRLSKM